MSTEIQQLRERVAAAEQVCVLFGWLGIPNQDARGKAALQAWVDWSHRYGAPIKPADWNERIAELAARRDEIHEATLRKLRRDPNDGIGDAP